MTERRLLQVIAVLLAGQLVVQVVPGPFVACDRVETGERREVLGVDAPVFRSECADTWWPVGADAVGWIPTPDEPRPTLRPGETPLSP